MGPPARLRIADSGVALIVLDHATRRPGRTVQGGRASDRALRNGIFVRKNGISAPVDRRAIERWRAVVVACKWLCGKGLGSFAVMVSNGQCCAHVWYFGFWPNCLKYERLWRAQRLRRQVRCPTCIELLRRSPEHADGPIAG